MRPGKERNKNLGLKYGQTPFSLYFPRRRTSIFTSINIHAQTNDSQIHSTLLIAFSVQMDKGNPIYFVEERNQQQEILS